MNKPLTYQEAKNKIAKLQAEGKTEQARDLEIWMDNELDKAYEIAFSSLEELGNFAGGPRH